MRKYLLQTQFFTWLTIFVFATSCNGQVKTGLPKDSVREQKAIGEGQPKLVKTQGTNQYANMRCGLQDKDGNLWFGSTGEGVYRYDGKLFTQFTVKDGLSSNTVYSILQDKEGDIWFGTDDGLCRYNGKNITGVSLALTNGVYLYSGVTANNSSATKNAVWSMLQDKSGTLWLGTSEGVYRYNGASFSRFLDNDGIINDGGLHLKMVDCILEDSNGNIWFASGTPPGMEGLCRYDGTSVTSFKPGGEKWIRYIIEDKNGIIWLGTRSNGNWRYDGKIFSKYTDKEGIGNAMLVDKAGNIWFDGGEHDNGYGGDGGIWRYDGKSFTNFTVKDGLGDYSVWSMVEDKAGHIWVGTRNNGLYRFDGTTFTAFSE